MVHVTVGTANAACGIITAARSQVPMLFTAGRTPITEEGLPGARDLYIHWAQESFDQAAMVREYVKWDYELRTPVQLEAVVDRAFELMLAEPRGPVYLTLPREVLAERLESLTITSPARRHAPGPPVPRSGCDRAGPRICWSRPSARSSWCPARGATWRPCPRWWTWPRPAGSAWSRSIPRT